MDATERQASINLRSVGMTRVRPLNRIVASLLSAAALLAGPGSEAAERAFFRSPPTAVSLHNPASTENQRYRSTISVVVPDNAGTALQDVILYQIGTTEPWDWGRKQPELYLGNYGMHKKGETGLAAASVSDKGDELTIRLQPPIEPGQQVNLIFRGTNPDADIYMWSTSFVPAGDNPRVSDGPTLRQHVYRIESFN